MSDALLIAIVAIAFAAIVVVRAIRFRKFRAAAAPVGAAASVLRDVYSGNGTQSRSAAEFDVAQPTSMVLDGDDPLRVHGIRGSGGAGRPSQPTQ